MEKTRREDEHARSKISDAEAAAMEAKAASFMERLEHVALSCAELSLQKIAQVESEQKPRELANGYMAFFMLANMMMMGEIA